MRGKDCTGISAELRDVTSNVMVRRLLVWVNTIGQIFSQTSPHINLVGQESLTIFYRWRNKFSERQVTSPRSHSQVIKLESYSAACGWHLLVAGTKAQIEKCSFIQLRSEKNLRSISPLPVDPPWRPLSEFALYIAAQPLYAHTIERLFLLSFYSFTIYSFQILIIVIVNIGLCLFGPQF